MEINGAYPTVALMSVDRGVFSVMRVSWSDKNVKAFINGVLSRTYALYLFTSFSFKYSIKNILLCVYMRVFCSEKSMKLTASPSIESVSEWDGKDSKPPQEEAPLDADWNTD